jgi:hypothetical protein
VGKEKTMGMDLEGENWKDKLHLFQNFHLWSEVYRT